MTFLLKEAGFVLVGRRSFLPCVQPARKEKWEQKKISGEHGRYPVQNQYLVLANLGMRKVLLLHVPHPIEMEQKVWLSEFYLLFNYKIVWDNFSLQFPYVKRAQDRYAVLCHWIWMVLKEMKLKAGMNEHDCNKLTNNGGVEFLLLLRPDHRSLAYVSSLLPAASPSPPPPPPAATKPFLKLREQHIVGWAVRNPIHDAMD